MGSKTAFILMPFADVYEHLISSTLNEAGYIVKRADDIKSQNNIIGDIIGSIIDSDIVVADLTGSNPNVYYELGIAHALDKKVILITQEIDDLPFDLKPYRVITYSSHFFKMEQAKKELRELAIEAFNGSLPFSNPVKDFGNVHISLGEGRDFDDSIKILPMEGLGLIDYHIMFDDGFKGITIITSEIASKLIGELTPSVKKYSEKISSGKYDLK